MGFNTTISGVKFTYKKSQKEIGPDVIKAIKERYEAIDKIMPEYKELLKKVGIYKTQISALEQYVKDFHPEHAKELRKAKEEEKEK